MGALTAGVSAALLIPAPPVAEAGIWGTVIQGAIGAIRAQNKYSDVRSQLLDMGNSPAVQKKLFDQDRAKHGQDDSEENLLLVDGVMNQLIERGYYALEANSLPFRWGVNADDSFNASCTAADYISINRGLITALSGDYIAIYTVDPETDHYTEYSSTSDYEGLGLAKEGKHFFEESRQQSLRAIYLEDLDLFLSTFTRETVFQHIERDGLFVLNYRLVMDGEPRYVCLKAALVKEKDGPQLIVGVTNIDAQVKRDEEYAYNLSVARDKANLDELTGVKNKHAYVDVESQLDSRIDNGTILPFAIVVLDINGLKEVNDTKGHQAGDLYLQQGCSMICGIFQHSPVFRVGGDEFVVIAQGKDYEEIDALMAQLAERNEAHQASGKVVVAGGMARYENNTSVSAVFEKADGRMYENKKKLKSRATSGSTA